MTSTDDSKVHMQFFGSPSLISVKHAPGNPWALLQKDTPSAFPPKRKKKCVRFVEDAKKHDGMKPEYEIVDDLLAKCFYHRGSKDPCKRALAISYTPDGVRKGMYGVKIDLRVCILVMSEFASLVQRLEALADGVAISVFPQGGGHQIKIDKRHLPFVRRLMEAFSEVYKIE